MNFQVVPRSNRQLITGESANQSTNLPAVNLTAASVKPANRHYFISGSDACVMMRGNNANLPPPAVAGKRGDEPEGLLKCRYYGANTGQALAGSNIEALFCANAAFFVGRLLMRIAQILFLFVSRNKRLRNSALDKAASNQLVPSRPQGRLR